MASQQPQPVTFVPFTTFVDPAFWSEVNRRKVNEWQLNQTAQPLVGTYTCGISSSPSIYITAIYEFMLQWERPPLC